MLREDGTVPGGAVFVYRLRYFPRNASRRISQAVIA